MRKVEKYHFSSGKQCHLMMLSLLNLGKRNRRCWALQLKLTLPGCCGASMLQAIAQLDLCPSWGHPLGLTKGRWTKHRWLGELPVGTGFHCHKTIASLWWDCLVGRKRWVSPRSACGGARSDSRHPPPTLLLCCLIMWTSSCWPELRPPLPLEDIAKDSTQKCSIPFFLLCLLINTTMKNYGTIWLSLLPLSLYYRWTSPHQHLLKNRNKGNCI